VITTNSSVSNRLIRQSLLAFTFLTVISLSFLASAAGQPQAFDHDSTGFLLSGSHGRLACDACHKHGIFKGTPKRCQGCHSPASAIATTRKPPNHIESNEICDDCHTEVSWAGARMDHVAITGSCQTCHDGRKATGKTGNHIQSNNNCDECHRTIAWVPARFDHSNVTGSCFSCHNGTTARGKPGNHVQSSNTCDDCHRTTAWVPAGFDHSNVTGSCFNCHNGTQARGKPNNHIASDNLCENCHRTTAWIPASFDHSNVTTACSGCHNGTTATGKPGNHIQSGNDCEGCHSTTAWSPAIRVDHSNLTAPCSSCHNNNPTIGKSPNHFGTSLECDQCHDTNSFVPARRYSHTSPNYPGDHLASVTCINCHTSNNQNIAWPNAAYQPDCAGCHANDYKIDPHKKYESPDEFYTVSELRDCTTSCHILNRADGSIKEARNGRHTPSRSAW